MSNAYVERPTMPLVAPHRSRMAPHLAPATRLRRGPGSRFEMYMAFPDTGPRGAPDLEAVQGKLASRMMRALA
jgi:hypothetical protein